MVKFKDVMSIINTNSIVLSHTAVGKTSYICNGWTRKDFQRLVEDFGEAEVMRVNFHTSYGDTPEIFLNPEFQPNPVKNAEFECSFETKNVGGFGVRTNCKVNLATKEITDIVPWPKDTEDLLRRATRLECCVIVSGVCYLAVAKDELPKHPDAFWW